MESENKTSGEVEYIPLRVLDKEYYVANFKVSQKVDPMTEDEKILFTKKNAFLMILDRSGSMSGGPWKALVEGAKLVAERIYEQREFENFNTLFFNNLCAAMPTESYEDFCNKIDKVTAGSTTNFVATFDKIITYATKEQPEDITVLFLTDGNDTCNSKEAVQTSLDNLKNFLNIKEISSRFYTIGLSSDHDAILLNKIAQAGSDLGNFFFVDYKEDNGTRNYKDTIKDCLVKTFDLGIPGGSLSVEFNYADVSKRVYLTPIDADPEDAKAETDRKLYQGTVVLDALPDGELELKLVGEDHSLFVKPVEATEVDVGTKLKTEISIIGQILFDSVQCVVGSKSLGAAEGKQIYEKLQALDARVSEMIEEGFKIKNRGQRKQLIQSCQAFKDKCFSVIETLRDVVINNQTMDITRIAKLNDLAYKAIRSKGLKKRLDERALKNEEYYKTLDKQIQDMVATFDFAQIAEKHQDIIDTVGDCPLT
mmetsp:Transcript_42755/g.50107  ORF Transcript_42755/g.50107 Transcript_42755/m.50107 type:complete len:481 (-) Transcript_42755:1748-3190(-)